MKPSIGRIVHYVTERNDHRPAIIVDIPALVYGAFGGPDERVTLQVFVGPIELSPPAHSLVAVRHEEQKVVGTWHWPERE